MSGDEACPVRGVGLASIPIAVGRFVECPGCRALVTPRPAGVDANGNALIRIARHKNAPARAVGL